MYHEIEAPQQLGTGTLEGDEGIHGRRLRHDPVRPGPPR
jgi:hypothetical protein